MFGPQITGWADFYINYARQHSHYRGWWCHSSNNVKNKWKNVNKFSPGIRMNSLLLSNVFGLYTYYATDIYM